MTGPTKKHVNPMVYYVLGGIVILVVGGYILDAYILTEFFQFIRSFFR